MNFRAACAVRPGDGAALGEVAFTLMLAGDLEAAAGVCAQVLDRQPDDVGALATLGAVRRSQGDLATALDCFRRASTAEPSHLGVAFELADVLQALDRQDDAEAALNMALAIDPAHRPSLTALGRLCSRQGRHAQAAFLLQTARRCDPDDPDLACEVAAALAALGRLADAEGAYRSALAATPEHVQALLGLGLTQRRRGDIVAAAQTLEAAARLAADHPGIQCEAAYTHLILGRLAEAKEAYGRALVADPQTGAALRGLSQIALREGRTGEAVDASRRAIAADPSDPAAHIELSIAHRTAGDTAAALAVIDAALALHGDDANLRLERGLALRDRDDRQGALEAFLAASQAGARRGAIEAAAEYLALGQPDAARASLEAALADDPDDYDAAVSLAELALLAVDPEPCLPLCRRLISAHPTRARPHALYCRALILAGRPAEARLALQGAEAIVPRSAEWDAARLVILRTLSDRPAAAALAEATRDGPRGDIELWSERIETLLFLGEVAAAQAALADPPPATAFQRARAALQAARCADLQWRLPEAIGACETALAEHPDTPAAHEMLGRLRFLTVEPELSAAHLRRWLDRDLSGRRLRGEPLKLTQTLPGQLLNELVLDEALLAALREIGRCGAAERIEPLLQVIRRDGDPAPPAIYLLLALREAGALDPGPAADPRAASPIPRRIMQFWPHAASWPRAEEAMERWRRAHADYGYVRFDRRGAARYLASRGLSDAAAAFARAIDADQASDIFRLAYLLQEGGWFVDHATGCQGRLDALGGEGAAFVGYQEPFANLGVALMASVPGEPVIARALELAVAAILRGDGDIVWLSTGPGLLSRAFADVLARQAEGWRRWLTRRRILNLREVQTIAALSSVALPKSGPRPG